MRRPPIPLLRGDGKCFHAAAEAASLRPGGSPHGDAGCDAGAMQRALMGHQNRHRHASEERAAAFPIQALAFDRLRKAELINENEVIKPPDWESLRPLFVELMRHGLFEPIEIISERNGKSIAIAGWKLTATGRAHFAELTRELE